MQSIITNNVKGGNYYTWIWTQNDRER